jgi:hypothetical protein
MFTKLTLGAAALAVVAFVAPVSAAPLMPQPYVAEEGLVQQVSDDDDGYRWRRRRHDYDDHRWRRHRDDDHHQRHCRRVCHGHMHYDHGHAHCYGHWEWRCHRHHY